MAKTLNVNAISAGVFEEILAKQGSPRYQQLNLHKLAEMLLEDYWTLRDTVEDLSSPHIDDVARTKLAYTVLHGLPEDSDA